jgi:hypothetical protein
MTQDMFFFFWRGAQGLGLIKSREFLLHQFFNIDIVKLLTPVICSIHIGKLHS